MKHSRKPTNVEFTNVNNTACPALFRFLNKDMLITVSTLLKDIASVSELCYTGIKLCSIMTTRRAHCRREESMLH